MRHDNLIFLLCTPRSGSTLLQRMIGSHSDVFTHPEPHLLTPLYHLGYYNTVDKAPYDHINAAAAFREFTEELPRGEEDYLDALRAYASTLYERVLSPTGKSFFLDKTPAYGLIAPFIARLYPSARFVVLTRHPLAITHSVANSFFNGDYQAAAAASPIAEQYVPALASFMQTTDVPFVHVRYEDLVSEPEREMKRVLAHLDLPFESGVINYGDSPHLSKSYGDPMNVERHTAPVTSSLQTWAADLNARPEALQHAIKGLNSVSDEDLETFGYPRGSLLAALDLTRADRTRVRTNPAYRLKRRVLLSLRKNIHRTSMGDAVRKLRYYCDVLLRE